MQKFYALPLLRLYARGAALANGPTMLKAISLTGMSIITIISHTDIRPPFSKTYLLPSPLAGCTGSLLAE